MWFLFQLAFFRFHVHFQGCNIKIQKKHTSSLVISRGLSLRFNPKSQASFRASKPVQKYVCAKGQHLPQKAVKMRKRCRIESAKLTSRVLASTNLSWKYLKEKFRRLIIPVLILFGQQGYRGSREELVISGQAKVQQGRNASQHCASQVVYLEPEGTNQSPTVITRRPLGCHVGS